LTIGQGTCLVRPGQAQNVVNLGVGCGYRVFDTAQKYGNEAGVGKALSEAVRNGKLTRGQVYVSTKVWVDNMGAERTAASVATSARELGLGPIDCVLIHWPGQVRAANVPASVRVRHDRLALWVECAAVHQARCARERRAQSAAAL
jgi:2,5-diketo-D-gluconate reductase B